MFAALHKVETACYRNPESILSGHKMKRTKSGDGSTTTVRDSVQKGYLLVDNPVTAEVGLGPCHFTGKPNKSELTMARQLDWRTVIR